MSVPGITSLTIKRIVLLAGGFLLVPVFAFFAFLNFEIADISGLTQQQNAAVAGQHSVLSRQNELSELQERAYQRQSELLDFIRLTDNRLELLKQMQLEFSRLERATFSAALSRRVNQQIAMTAQRDVFLNSVKSASEQWPELTRLLQHEYSAYAENMDTVSQILGKRNKRPAIKLFLEKVKPISESINARLTEEIDAITESQGSRVKSVSDTIGELQLAAEEIEHSGERVKDASREVGDLAGLVATRVLVLKHLSVLAGIALVVIGPFIAIWLARYISTPLQALTSAMDKMSSGNLNQKVAVTSDNEIGRLEKGFNSMTSQLARAHDELDKNREILALKVDERTRDLNIAKEQAEAASRAKSEFLATMSHEIRTPMNGVLGMTELLLGTDMDEKQKRFATTVHRSANSLLSIINDILDFSKIESGKMELNISEFSLRELMEDAAEMFAERADDKGIEMLCDLPADLAPSWRGDAERIGQIVNNLVGNAIKFTDCGEVVLRVTTKSVSDNLDRVRITVRDTGIGIPDAHQRQIFDSFVQADASTTRIFGGTGLGLVICKQLVELMDGEIGVRSEAGEGSVFWCEFNMPFSAEAEANQHTLHELSGYRVLVVDDNSTNREILHHQLASWEMIDVPARDGKDGLKTLTLSHKHANKIDLIILDMHMPHMDGREFAKTVSADPATRDIPIILLSSVCDTGSAESLRECGINYSLTKPARQTELLNAIQHVLFNKIHVSNELPDSQADENIRISADILLVEDNAINQQVALVMLESMGCSVSVAEDGLEALSFLAEHSVDMVLMDCQMPNMDGFTATEKIRECEQADNSRLPVIALTANAMSGDRERCIAAGMDGYLRKPFSLEELQQTILEFWTPGEQSGELLQDLSDAGPSTSRNDQFNSAMLENMRALQGGEEILKRVIELFHSDTPKQIEQLQRALKDGDTRTLWQVAHKMKSSCANLGAERMAAMCASLESLGRKDTIVGAHELCRELPAEYSAVSVRLDQLAPDRAA